MWRARTGGGPGRGLGRGLAERRAGAAESEGQGLVGRGPVPQRQRGEAGATYTRVGRAACRAGCVGP